jgi:hypothetical protein
MGPFDPVTPDGPTNKPTSLYTNEGLQASYKDLDQIFDNSDDTSSDETVSMRSSHVVLKPICIYLFVSQERQQLYGSHDG